MIDYLQKKGGYTSSGLTREEKKELENLRNEVKKYRELESAILEVHSDEEKNEESESNSISNDSESEDNKMADEVLCLPLHHSLKDLEMERVLNCIVG